MKRLLILCLAAMTLFSCKEKIDYIVVGDKIPSFIVTSEVYGTVESSELKGNVTMLFFFATWCGPCQDELAAVQEKLVPMFEGKENFRLLVLGREHTDAELAEYNEVKGFTFPLYPDVDRQIYSQFAKQTIPRAYLIDKDGKVVDFAVGYDAEHFDAMCSKAMELL